MEEVRAEARRRWEQSSTGERSRPQTAGTRPEGEQEAERRPTAEAAGSSSSTSSRPASRQKAQGEDGVPLLDQALQQWNRLGEEQRYLLIGLLLILCFGGSQAVYLLVAMGIAWYLHTQLPPTNSFEPYFRSWFCDDYFPKVSQKLQQDSFH
eukprot:TRINITY_DN20606_c0_g1_i4.p1 TRINITY_DN20606_c0_g1~~TRINITY_DN20606_c0_g1_i4.p1  ORF type:complete len:152 (-),score=25.30 TRINITY_DN20606_c0_g1_i4:109-564(-)